LFAQARVERPLLVVTRPENLAYWVGVVTPLKRNHHLAALWVVFERQRRVHGRARCSGERTTGTLGHDTDDKSGENALLGALFGASARVAPHSSTRRRRRRRTTTTRSE